MLIAILAVVLAVIALAFMTDDERYVAAPGIACVVIVSWLWMTLWNRDKKIPFFDVGMFCALSTLVYTVYPLVNYWVGGFEFGLLSDSRLRSYSISPVELGLFHLRHVLYLVFFIIFYWYFRGKGSENTVNVRMPSRPTQLVIVISFLILTVYFFLLQLITGVNFNTSYETVEYAEHINSVASLPLVLIQVSGKLWGILFMFKIALLSIVVNRCRQRRWFLILFLWIVAEIIQAFTLKGARTGLVLFLMATALLYHRMIKPLTGKFLFTMGTSLLVLFLFLGIYRYYPDISSLQDDYAQEDALILSSGNEFQGLLGTAYDVYQRKEAGSDLPWYLYINDIVAMLPPQQLIPFEKIAASEWYLREIGVSGTGVGFMWGVISQSIVGWDWLELVLRGAVLGYILAKFHRWYLKRQYGFLETMLYMYICLKIYYTFRDTTFSLLANIVWEAIPFYVLLRIGVAVISPNGWRPTESQNRRLFPRLIK